MVEAREYFAWARSRKIQVPVVDVANPTAAQCWSVVENGAGHIIIMRSHIRDHTGRLLDETNLQAFASLMSDALHAARQQPGAFC